MLDTVVLSELRKRDCDPNVAGWLEAQAEDDLFISAISIGEIVRGIAGIERRDAAFAKKLSLWLDDILVHYNAHVLDFDAAAARIWGRLFAEIGHGGADLQIAAIARARGLIVVTRNIRHFKPTGVRLVDPWETL